MALLAHNHTELNARRLAEVDGARTLGGYLSPVETLVNIVFKLDPIAVTATTMAIEMPAAISAYSMAVAPLVSFRNRRSMATFPL